MCPLFGVGILSRGMRSQICLDPGDHVPLSVLSYLIFSEFSFSSNCLKRICEQGGHLLVVVIPGAIPNLQEQTVDHLPLTLVT
jgi:hypothetical protein